MHVFTVNYELVSFIVYVLWGFSPQELDQYSNRLQCKMYGTILGQNIISCIFAKSPSIKIVFCDDD